jgi:hypothetical protein
MAAIKQKIPAFYHDHVPTSVPTHSFGTRGDVFFQRLPAACILL